MKKILIGLWLVGCTLAADAQQTLYNIFDFGATHDTTQVQTAAINAAIEACSSGGGGRVMIPAGKYSDPATEGKRHDLVSGSRWNRYWASYSEVVEDEKGYPQPTVWGNLPSFGLFLRHVGTVCVDGATFRPEGKEPRVPLIAVDVDELRLHRLSVEGEAKRDMLLHGVKHCQADEIMNRYIKWIEK